MVTRMGKERGTADKGIPAAQTRPRPLYANASANSFTPSIRVLTTYTSKSNRMTSEMPHSVTPDSTLAEESSTAMSQSDAIKPEPDTQDVAMEDAPTATAVEKPKVNLEELFDDEDSDEEFPSSAPASTSQEDASQPAPMYAPPTDIMHS